MGASSERLKAIRIATLRTWAAELEGRISTLDRYILPRRRELEKSKTVIASTRALLDSEDSEDAEDTTARLPDVRK